MSQKSRFGPDPLGATPLTDEDLEGLIPDWVSDKAELDLAEFENIIQARKLLERKDFQLTELLDDLFIRNLHKQMFSEVWSWAGQYRKRETSIGIDPISIQVRVKNLVDDAKYWFQEPANGEIDLLACKLHRDLVWIHPFPNGNGRLCRLYVDLVLVSLKTERFSWGGDSINRNSEIRSKYIQSLKEADKGNYQPLLEFVRT